MQPCEPHFRCHLTLVVSARVTDEWDGLCYRVLCHPGEEQALSLLAAVENRSLKRAEGEFAVCISV